MALSIEQTKKITHRLKPTALIKAEGFSKNTF